MTNTNTGSMEIDAVALGMSRYDSNNALIKNNGTRRKMEWMMKQPEVIHFAALKNIVEPLNASTSESESCRREVLAHQERSKISEARAADAIRHLALDDNVTVDYELVNGYTLHLTLEADTMTQLDKAYQVVSKACWSQVLDHTAVISDHHYDQETITKILDIDTDAQLNIDKHTITVSCPSVQGMWQALAQANCIAKGNGILHKVDASLTRSLMEKRGEWWRKRGCLVSIVNPILFLDNDDDTEEDNDKLLVYIEGSAAENVRNDIDKLIPESNHLELRLNPWEHAFLLHQYDKILELCDQRGATLVLNGVNLQCINVQSTSLIDDLLLNLASTTLPTQISSPFYFVDQSVTYMNQIPSNLSLVTVYRSAEDHDFICGKKNGKLHRIQNDTGCAIQVGDSNPSNDVRSGTRRLVGFRITGNKVSEAAQALVGEFPAECTFYIPEEHHKRLIGYGGQTIQALMKRHGVYVKFVSHHRASSGEYEAGGPFGSALIGNPIGGTTSSSMRKDNVVVRTPRKNSLVLERVKKELLEMANLPPTTTTIKEGTQEGRPEDEMILVDKQALLALQNVDHYNSIVIKSWLLDVSSVKVSVTVDRLQPMIKVR